MKNLVTSLFYTICFLFPLGQIVRLSFLGQQINTYLYEIPLFLLLVAMLLIHKQAPLLQLKKKLPALIVFLTYLSCVFLFTSFFYSFEVNVIGMLYLIRLSVYLLFFVYFRFYLNNNQQFKIHLTRGFIFAAVFTLFFSVVQYFLYSNLRNISYLGWDPHWYRMVGTFFDPPIAGAIYSLFFLYFYNNRTLNDLVRYLFLGAFAVSLFLTYSRGAYIAFFVVLLLIFFKRRILIGLVTIALLGSVILLILPKPFGESVNLSRTFSIYSRLGNYQEAVKEWSKQPVFGVGYNRIRYSRDKNDFSSKEDLQNNHAGASYHSSFLIMAVTGGVVGLILFIWLLLSFSQLGNLAMWSTVFLTIISLTDNVFLHPFVLILFLIMVAHQETVSLSDTRP